MTETLVRDRTDIERQISAGTLVKVHHLRGDGDETLGISEDTWPFEAKIVTVLSQENIYVETLQGNRWTVRGDMLEVLEDSQIRDLEAQVTALREELSKAHQRLEDIVNSAHEYADEKGLCRDFDNFMGENGLRPRSRDFEVVVEFTARATISISATSEDEAMDEINERMDYSRLTEIEYAIDGIEELYNVDIQKFEAVEADEQ